MLKTIIKRELQQNVYSLRFQISLIIVLCIFVLGTLSFIESYQASLQKYSEFHGNYLEEIKDNAQRSASQVAVTRRTYMIRPRGNGFMSDCKEKYLPNAVTFNAYNVF